MLQENSTHPLNAVFKQKNVLLLCNQQSPWIDFLHEFFEETQAKVNNATTSQMALALTEKIKPEIVFLEPSAASTALFQKFRAIQASETYFRIYELGQHNIDTGLQFNGKYLEVPEMMEFLKSFAATLPLDKVLKVLVVDDEPDIGLMVKDHLRGRVDPVFEVCYAGDGEEGLRLLKTKPQDIVLLDLKMPIKGGCEVYRDILHKGIKVPVIIFFDAVSSHEIVDIHKIGRPAIVEKGSRQSSPPELMSLIKKMAFFG